MARNSTTGVSTRSARGASTGVRWFYALLLAVIAIAAIVGVISTASMGHTPIAVAIGLVALAFFSRVGA